jgi:hypothetical protein
MEPRPHLLVVGIKLGHGRGHVGRVQADHGRRGALLVDEPVQVVPAHPHAAAGGDVRV